MEFRYSISPETSAVQGYNYQSEFHLSLVEIPSVENSSSFSMTISESNHNYTISFSFARNKVFYGVKKNRGGGGVVARR
jgi:transcriptional regulator CtsR